MKKKKINKEILLKIGAVSFVAVFFFATIFLFFQLNTSAAELKICPSSPDGNHKYDGGVCFYCQAPMSHKHNWYNGFCDLCGMTCDHEGYVYYQQGEVTDALHWSGCSLCGVSLGYVPHVYQNGFCSLCSYSCNHSGTDSNGVCVFCGPTCSHTWSNGKCTICGKSCSHTWSNGKCTICGKSCFHLWQMGACITCKYVCPHDSFLNGACLCGYVCPHPSWSDGKCTHCFIPCSHDLVDGVCVNCGTSCIHTWSNGTCGTCGKSCTHTWVNGICGVCSMFCTHSFVGSNGSCVHCGITCSHPEVAYSFYDDLNHLVYCKICFGFVRYEQHKEYYGVNHSITCSYCDTTFRDGLPIERVNFFSSTLYISRWSNTDGATSSLSLMRDGENVFFRSQADPKRAELNLGVSFNGYLPRYMFIKYRVNPNDHIGYINLRFNVDGTYYNFGGVNEGTTYGDWRVVLLDLAESPFASKVGEKCSLALRIVHEGGFDFSYFALSNSVSYLCDLLQDGEYYYTCNNYLMTDKFPYYAYDKEGCIVSCPHEDIVYQFTEGDLGHVSFCSVCQNVVAFEPHAFDYNHSCIVCGYTCSHSAFDGYKCTYCGFGCEHSFDNGICSICYYTCDHEGYVYYFDFVRNDEMHSSACALCGLTLSPVPHVYQNGFCSLCSYSCSHSSFDYDLLGVGSCAYCDFACEHDASAVSCTVCGFVCGVNASHYYNNGYCGRCGIPIRVPAIDIEDGFLNLFTSIYDAQATVFYGMLDYDILGINIANLIISVVALAIVIFILKKVL